MKKLRLSVLTIAITLATNSYANDDSYYLDSLVVSASGFEQDIKEAPASISIITQEDIQEKPIRDIGDAIDDEPGVEISKTKVGSSEVKIRGFDSAYTAILIDGKRQNASSGIVKNGFNPNGSFMPPLSTIERIEVIRGPASVLYGSDAIGGVVNIITKKHVDEFSGSIGLDATLQEHGNRYGNAYSQNAAIYVPVINNKLSFDLHASNFDKDKSNLRKPDGSYASHSNGDYQRYNFGGKVNYSINENHFIYVDYDRSFESGSVNSTSGRRIMSQKDWLRNNASINHEGNFSFGTLTSYIQYTNTKLVGSQASGPNGQGGLQKVPYSRLENQNYNIQSSLVSPIDLNDFGALNLTTGFNFNHERLYDEDALSAQNGRAIQNQSSIFAEGEYFITDKLSTTLGARYTYGNIFGSHISPRAYLMYAVNENISFKGGVATGYRIPNLSQIAPGITNISSSSTTSEITFGNPDLKAETSINYEFSTILDYQKFGNLTLTAFYTTFKDKVVSEEYAVGDTVLTGQQCTGVAGGVCYQYVNVDSSKAYGVEALYRSATYYNTNLDLSYTYTKTKITGGIDNGKPLSETPTHSISAKLNYTYNDFKAYIKMTAKYKTPVTNTKTSPDLAEYKNYELFDLGLSYTFNKQHHFAFMINNLFDTNYNSYYQSGRTYGSYYSDYIEGRNYWLSYRFDF